MSSVLDVCSKFQTYVRLCVRDCGKNKLCLLCKASVSEQGDVCKEDSSLVKAHHAKHHVPKDGMIWCNVCGCNICNAGQESQLEAHSTGTKHVKRSSGTKYCSDCGMIDPPHGHNASHVLKRLDGCTIIKMGKTEVEKLTVGCKRGNREAEALAVMAIVENHNVEDGYMTTKHICNEDFQKMFRANYAELDFNLQKMDEGECSVCALANKFNPDVKIHTGHSYRLEWTSVSQYFVGRQEKEADLRPFIPIAEAGNLDKDFLRQYYVFDQTRFGFVLLENTKEARKTAAKDFPSSASGEGSDHIY